ncbi:hypothetical protein D9M68_948230 [compost metagenome]
MPPISSGTPTTPSLPTVANSAQAPLAVRLSSDTMADVGKYTWFRSLPDSYSTWPSGMLTNSI